MKRFFFFYLIILGCAANTFAQLRYVAMNLERFDDRKYHFGFIVGANNSTLDLDIKSHAALLNNDIHNVRVEPLPGLDLAIVASYKLHTNIRVRTTPGISFQDRKIWYTMPDTVGFQEIDRVTESTNIEIPIFLKFRTNRYGNFAAYVITGGKYQVDMAARKSDQPAADDLSKIPLKKKDFSLVYGGGVDFFLPYFKFGIELRFSHGLGNILRPDGTPFTDPLNGIRGKSFQFVLTFEG